MKLHALALSAIAAVAMTAAPALAKDYDKSDRMMSERYSSEERMYFIGNLYPDLPPVSEVASKVTMIVNKQQSEVAHLAAMQPAAQTAGFTNVTTVYDAMIADHSTLAEFGNRWLSQYGYPTPSRPTAEGVADMAPGAGVEHMIAMHEKSFNEALEMRKMERSSTVRGMLLWSAASTARHLSWLRALDRDVDHGRKTVSARLESAMSTSVRHDEIVERIMVEDREMFGTVAQSPTVIEQVVEVPTTVERVVEVEKIVERPVERIVERVVEKPVYVERIVEKKIYITRPTTSKVAGQRGTYRRPAK